MHCPCTHTAQRTANAIRGTHTCRVGIHVQRARLVSTISYIELAANAVLRVSPFTARQQHTSCPVHHPSVVTLRVRRAAAHGPATPPRHDQQSPQYLPAFPLHWGLSSSAGACGRRAEGVASPQQAGAGARQLRCGQGRSGKDAAHGRRFPGRAQPGTDRECRLQGFGRLPPYGAMACACTQLVTWAGSTCPPRRCRTPRCSR